MLSAFQLENNRLTRLEVEESQPLVNAVWIDLVEPDDDERLRVQSELGQSLATRPELEDIEASARFFEDDDGLHIHSFFFFEDAEDHAGNSTVAFTIRDGRLFTLRERELPAFRLYRMRARSQSMVDGNAYELLLDLFETKIEQLADEIENIYSDLEQLSRVIMEGHQGDEYDEALSTLAELEDIGWKVRLCLMDGDAADQPETGFRSKIADKRVHTSTHRSFEPVAQKNVVLYTTFFHSETGTSVFCLAEASSAL